MIRLLVTILFITLAATTCDDTNCLQCDTSSDICTQCSEGFQLVGNKCFIPSLCNEGCLTCSNNVCYECDSSLNLLLSEGTCVCPTNATRNTNGLCVCPAFQTVYNGTCICGVNYVMGDQGCVCAPHTFTTTEGVCKGCPSTCLTCSSTTCCSSCSASRNRYLSGCSCYCIPYQTCS